MDADSGSEAAGKPLVPSAFVSWAHSDEAWESEVARFTSVLRTLGIDVDVDLFHPDEVGIDWTRWGVRRIAEVDYALILASEQYAQRWQGTNVPFEGAGAAREADALHGLFDEDQDEFQRKVIAIILPGLETGDVLPPDLRRVVRFVLPGLEAEHFEPLIRRPFALAQGPRRPPNHSQMFSSHR